MNVLVTGGSGYLGTHVRDFFAADDFSRRSGKDVRSEEDVKVASEYDLVIHLAAHLDKSPEGADECFATNVVGTLNLLKNISEGSTFIFVSTKDVYGRFADSQQLVNETAQPNTTWPIRVGMVKADRGALRRVLREQA